MMSDEMLSQDEIDALLRGDTDDECRMRWKPPS